MSSLEPNSIEGEESMVSETRMTMSYNRATIELRRLDQDHLKEDIDEQFF